MTSVLCAVLIILTSSMLTAIGPHVGEAPSHTSQEPTPDPQPEKAAALIKRAIAARGGERYLNVKTVVSRGQFTPYAKGEHDLPQPFVDYIVYPTKERTEFGKGSQRFVQTNVDNTGWTYNADGKLIKKQTEEQVKSYLQGVRYDLDNVLRREWNAPGTKLVFLKLREIQPSVFSEGVRIDYSDGGSITIYFDSQTGLPLLTQFKSIGDNGPRNDEVRFYQWISFDGINCPKIQDTYHGGVQSSRVYYESYLFNSEIPEKLFEMPANPKEVK